MFSIISINKRSYQPSAISYKLSAICFLFSFSLRAQDTFPQNYFGSPLGIPIALAGTFGEIRSDHYHTGIDIRTDGREGLPVHAAADGYITRIAVSPFGYGNALYITHSNGYITLYGHLSRFNNTIKNYVRKKQYESQRYEQDITVPSGELRVLKGDTIAYSGSTGAAQGPHLHFEIRKAGNDDPVNPLLFGYTTIDHIPPVIKGISLYPLNDTSNINGEHGPFYLKATKKANRYFIVDDTAIRVYGSIGVGISCYDIPDSEGNRNGPYIKVLKDNNDTIYYTRMDVLSFATIRYVNGHIDYASMHEGVDTLEYSFLQDNDKLNIYKKLINRGRIYFKDGISHQLEYDISDFNGNTSTLSFTIKSAEKRGTVNHDASSPFNSPFGGKNAAYWSKPFDFKGDGIQVHIPANALFKDLKFHYTVDSNDSRTAISPVYNVVDEDTPLNSNYTLMIKPKTELPDSLMKKAVMVRIDGNKIVSIGGKWENGFMTASPKYFGSYSVMLDLNRPLIKPYNIYKDKNMAKESEMEFEVTDNLSGIGSFNAYVDGKWILMEYNPKKDMIYYTFDEHVAPGQHHLKLVVSDGVGNTTVYQTDFKR